MLDSLLQEISDNKANLRRQGVAKTLPVVSGICLAWCARVRPGVRGQGDTVLGAQLPLSGGGGWGRSWLVNHCLALQGQDSRREVLKAADLRVSPHLLG